MKKPRRTEVILFMKTFIVILNMEINEITKNSLSKIQETQK